MPDLSARAPTQSLTLMQVQGGCTNQYPSGLGGNPLPAPHTGPAVSAPDLAAAALATHSPKVVREVVS